MLEAILYNKLVDNFVKCNLCAHRCKIAPSKFGICGVRQNVDGILNTHVYGKVIAAHVDPIEKKPLYHFLPGSHSFSIATIGCNFKCQFCQNWQISQRGVKNSDSSEEIINPEEIVAEAKKNNCKSISYTYTEPTIFFEYALATAILAKKEGLYNVFVTNGFMTPEAIEMIKPYLSAANVDLKSFNDDFYKNICHGKLEPVLNSIKLMKKNDVWIEITTLLIPGKNDSEDELNEIAKFIANVGKEIPWHISRFHPDYKFMDNPATSIGSLKKAYEIGKKNGLKYIYLGNVTEGNNTYCSNCNSLLVERVYFDVTQNNIVDNKCKKCKSAVEGHF